MSDTKTVEVRCDMRSDCDQPVTYIDCKGWAYCTQHGKDRQTYQFCRKLRPHELNRLKRGQSLLHY